MKDEGVGIKEIGDTHGLIAVFFDGCLVPSDELSRPVKPGDYQMISKATNMDEAF